ncbi:MAG: 3-phosphoshikimate 1-carboxyvinyltransferase [Peptococcaceae bacterium]|jgi:3-phosphoshikimate 1-carboxyvinyltransferase|nr:3-phosphoshikimate 1-carboxyvinyltransferase [Peptococcaceae bacterium]
MRGVAYIQAPTTLLAQVDSSVGGKTAVNLAAGKNLVGVFYQPKLVIIDTQVLGTLAPREFRCGLAEVIKYGAISAPGLFAGLREKAARPGIELTDVIGECCRIKSGIVERDERDTGERALLNFGHTFGHAAERLGDYSRHNHGEAVAIGMVLAAALGEKTGVTAAGTAAALRDLLELYGLDTRCPYTAGELLPLLALDKKSAGAGVRLVLLREIGAATTCLVEGDRLGELLSELAAEGWLPAERPPSGGGRPEPARGEVAPSGGGRARAEPAKIIGRFPAGIVTVPPSKSLCHRAILCGALAAGDSAIRGVVLSEDIRATLAGVGALGGSWRLAGDVLRLRGGQPATGGRIDCGESGSTLRFLIPLAGLSGRETVFTGRGRLLARPLGVYEALFADRGLAFAWDQREVRLRGPLRAGVYEVPGDISSQFVSGLLLALPLADGDSEIQLTTPLESRRYVDLTLDVTRAFGVTVEEKANGYLIRGGQRYRPADYEVEGDYSQAAFFLAAGALGRDTLCAGLRPDSRQGDRAILSVLAAMGASVEWRDGLLGARPGRGDRGGRLKAVTVDAREIPDLVPPIAALCCFGEGTSRIINAGRLRFKESDRLAALVAALSGLGGRIGAGPDSLIIEGQPSLPGGRADAAGDHRIAMAVALAAIGCAGAVALEGWRSVDKSYPDFWRDFEKSEKQ